MCCFDPHSISMRFRNEITFWSKEFSVAWAAMDLLIRSITSQCWVQWTMTFATAETSFVPHGTFGQLLLGSKNSTTATCYFQTREYFYTLKRFLIEYMYAYGILHQTLPWLLLCLGQRMVLMLRFVLPCNRQ